MVTREIAYDADGAHMIGHYAAPDRSRGRLVGILVAHAGPGLDDYGRSIADRVAAAGYAAFALDYHGGGTVLADMPQMMSRINGWLADPTGIRVRVAKALEVLQSQPDVDGARIGCMGYCFGGTAVLELARSGASIAATVGFHSGLKTARPADAAQIKGQVLVCLGADDPLIPVAERNAFEEEMRRGGVDWQMHVYGGAQHSFTTAGIDARAAAAGLQGMKYHAEADRCSWRAMLGTFADVFGTTT